MQTRRSFLATSGATITLLPFIARADGHSGDMFETPTGPLTVHPVSHASVVLETPNGTLYVDPVGDPALYDAFPKPDLILITHEHGDHFNAETLTALMSEGTSLVVNGAVHEKLPAGIAGQSLANGDTTDVMGITINAVPAYNITEGRTQFHPQGRDNGYVLDLGGFRVYISGDTEDIPEMRSLEDIDLAFVCMNLPFTMGAEAAASAVSEFAPTYVYPYHYRGRDNGTQDPMEFANLLADGIEAKMGGWYG